MKLKSYYIITQGMAQQTGRQIGMTAAPPYAPIGSVSFSPKSLLFQALALAQGPFGLSEERG